MSRVTINFEHKVLANAFVIWFEDGAGLEAFKSSYAYDVVNELRDGGDDIPHIEEFEIDYERGETSYSVDHEITLTEK